MPKGLASVFLAGAVFLTAGAAAAHHSAAMFDLTRTETIQGVVTKYQWTNPHGFLFVSVEEGGKVSEYSIELTSPNLAMRRGWRPTSLKAGDKVSVVLNPFRDGAKGGRIFSVTTPDGKVLTEH